MFTRRKICPWETRVFGASEEYVKRVPKSVEDRIRKNINKNKEPLINKYIPHIVFIGGFILAFILNYFYG